MPLLISQEHRLPIVDKMGADHDKEVLKWERAIVWESSKGCLTLLCCVLCTCVY